MEDIFDDTKHPYELHIPPHWAEDPPLYFPESELKNALAKARLPPLLDAQGFQRQPFHSYARRTTWDDILNMKKQCEKDPSTSSIMCVPRFSMHTSFLCIAEEGVGTLWGMSGKSDAATIRSYKRIPPRTILIGDFVPRKDVFLFMVFDFLQCNGADGATLTFERRRSMMDTFLSQSDPFPSPADGKLQGALYVLLTTIRPFPQLGRVIGLVEAQPPPPRYILPLTKKLALPFFGVSFHPRSDASDFQFCNFHYVPMCDGRRLLIPQDGIWLRAQRDREGRGKEKKGTFSLFTADHVCVGTGFVLDNLLRRDAGAYSPDQDHTVECYFNCGAQAFRCKRIDNSGHRRVALFMGDPSVHAYLLEFGTTRPFTLHDVLGLTDSMMTNE